MWELKGTDMTSSEVPNLNCSYIDVISTEDSATTAADIGTLSTTTIYLVRHCSANILVADHRRVQMIDELVPFSFFKQRL